MINLIVSGACGKMGKRIIALAGEDKKLKIVGAIEAGNHPEIGKKVLDVEVRAGLEAIRDADVLIEFTNPQSTVEHLLAAVKYKKAAVIGTTGLDQQQLQAIKQASSQIPIIFSPNMSLGVNLLFRLVKQAAEKLTGYTADISEAHHMHKKDKPSGTAKRLAELIKQSWGCRDKQIKIDSTREGEIIGDHQVRFSGPEDQIIIKHSAKTRDIFAQGALAAARFIVKQAPGLYDMQDVLR
jgi:4-hydroxy-tetrahydrodipicolinate reductase